MNDIYIGELPANSEHLEHYGRLGMKWYQHIFTNPDGSPKDKSKNAEMNKKKLSKATDEEILERTKRLKIEKDYLETRKAVKELKSRKKNKSGENFVTKGLAKTGEVYVAQLSSKFLGSAINFVAKEMFDAEENFVDPKLVNNFYSKKK